MVPKDMARNVARILLLLIPTTAIPLAWAWAFHSPAMFAGAWLTFGTWLLLFDVDLRWHPVWANGIRVARVSKPQEAN